jgi:hypothetical protein
MAVLTVSGEPGCRTAEIANLTAQRLGFELITESTLARIIDEDFGIDGKLPEKAWRFVADSVLARLAAQHHVLAVFPNATFALRQYPDALRARIVGSRSYRAGALMLEHRLERPAATKRLERLDAEANRIRRARFGRATVPSEFVDIVLNGESLEPEAMADLLVAAARNRRLPQLGLMPATTEKQLQFQFRLKLASHRIRPPASVALKNGTFAHPSEEIFASLLDFYRISWEYEPRSFALDWDDDGVVKESFTPDFYLPEFGLYVELTTMKQAHVTKKNRKVRLLKHHHPGVRIQIFYQKDFQNLIFKYGLGAPGALT